jgi:hypothetical protein
MRTGVVAQRSSQQQPQVCCSMSLIYADWSRCTTLQLTTATGLLFHVPEIRGLAELHYPQHNTIHSSAVPCPGPLRTLDFPPRRSYDLPQVCCSISLIYADWRRCTTLQSTIATGLLFHVPTWPPVYEEHGPQQQTKFNIVLISDRQFLKFVSEHLTLTAKFILRSFGTLQRAGSFCPCMWPFLLPNKILSLLSLFHEERMT